MTERPGYDPNNKPSFNVPPSPDVIERIVEEEGARISDEFAAIANPPRQKRTRTPVVAELHAEATSLARESHTHPLEPYVQESVSPVYQPLTTESSVPPDLWTKFKRRAKRIFGLNTGRHVKKF